LKFGRIAETCRSLWIQAIITDEQAIGHRAGAASRKEVRLFLNASAALAAVGQKTGASRAIFDAASAAFHLGEMISSPAKYLSTQ
jgi:hypothetical protein